MLTKLKKIIVYEILILSIPSITVFTSVRASEDEATISLEVPNYVVSGKSPCIIMHHTKEPIKLSAAYPYTFVLYNGVRCPLIYFGGTHYYVYNDSCYPVTYY